MKLKNFLTSQRANCSAAFKAAADKKIVAHGLGNFDLIKFEVQSVV